MTRMPNTERPSLDQLRALGAALPPDYRVSSSEVADVAAAVAAVVAHGPEILKAAEGGSLGIAQFLHDHIAAQAEQAGVPAPEKGRDLQEPAPAVTPSPAGGIDYDALAAAIVAQQHKAQSAPATETPTDSTGPTEGNSVESAPSTSDNLL